MMMTHLQDPQLQKYLSTLKKLLQILPRNEREDVLREFESHVYDQEQLGRQPQDILNRLGAPEVYARSYLDQYSDQLRNQGTLPEHARFMFQQAIWPVLSISAIFVLFMQANALFIWWELFATGKMSLWNIIQFSVLSLPAIVVVMLPACTLIMVPMYIYRIRGTNSQNTLRSGRVWLMTLLAGLLLSGIGLGIQECIVPYANTQVIHIAKPILASMGARQTLEPVTSTDRELVSKTDEFKSVREMTAGQAFHRLSQRPAPRTEYIDYYRKFSLPLGALAFAFYGLLTASLMLSGLFHPRYTLIVIGFVIPFGGFLMLHNLALSERFSPLLQAFLPNLVLIAISLVFLLGMLMQLPKSGLELNHDLDLN